MIQQHLELGRCMISNSASVRTCACCGLNKPLSAYREDKRRIDQTKTECARCRNVQNQFRRSYRATLVRRFYNEQQGVCPVCDQPLDLNDSLALDHPHSAEAMHDHHSLAAAMTGLLHSTCNTGLGLLNDNPTVLRRAARYIERTRRYGQQTLDL